MPQDPEAIAQCQTVSRSACGLPQDTARLSWPWHHNARTDAERLVKLAA